MCQWRLSGNNPALWQREALAGENLWVLQPKEVREMFPGGSFVLSEPSNLHRFTSAARHA